MATRELQLRWEPAVCEICQRTLLRGEDPVSFYESDRVHTVCVLCTTRAHRQGWIREGTDVAQLAPAAHAERARSLVARLRGRRETDEFDGPEPWAGEAPPPDTGELGQDDLPHHVRAVPTASDAQAARAFELFNLSEHTRTVGGVIHSLGAPYVHASPASEGPLVDVLVVWELCWYRYEVDLENSVVRLRGQGYEPSELGAELPAANAIADERGTLTLAPA
jgi:hypothetical protein